jgi:hypothetical protein
MTHKNGGNDRAVRAAADRAKLRTSEWRQLERLADHGRWMAAKETVPLDVPMTGRQSAVALRNLRARGCASTSTTRTPGSVVGRPRLTGWRSSSRSVDESR